ncbi:MAG: prepilin-type N-terminal cleavage/methylation domain-containing protein [Candidatus Omnitrophota bacterium]
MLGRKGFTLIELLVVIIIVGILAAVAIPMMRGNVMRARASEALAGVGSIRSQMRMELAEHNAYNNDVVVGVVVGNVPGFQAGDLNGRFFSDADYSVTAVGASTFTVTATGAASGGTSGETMTGVTITIDQAGNIVETYP